MADVSRNGPPGARAAQPFSGQARLRLRTGGIVGRLLAAAAAAAACAGAAYLAVGFHQFQGAVARAELSRAPKADGIVVLTGGSQRLSDALALLADGKGKRLLISGVNEKTGRDEIARLTGVKRDRLDCCVDLGRSARNTIGNALEARRWAKANGYRSLLVVTANYHMPRTLEEFAHVMDDVKIDGHAVVSDAGEAESLSLRLLASEYAKYIVSRLRRTVEDDPEHSRLPVLVGRQKPLGHLPIESSGGG